MLMQSGYYRLRHMPSSVSHIYNKAIYIIEVVIRM